MAQAKDGDTVKVHYTGKLEDDVVFQTTVGRKPLEFTIGQEQLIPAFEQAIVGMSPGDSKHIQIPADQAFGPYHEELVRTVDRSQFPPEVEPEVGQRLDMSGESGRTVLVTVIDFSESSVTLDANHPLAGEDLAFDVELVDIT
jgi:FKBP-type peptidyl-prolyl cis-trans isomerase 2